MKSKKTKKIADSIKMDFDGDRPIHDAKEDRLGFGVIASNLATSILNTDCKEGLVVGIEGKWGSGKSSIINLLCNEVSKNKTATLIQFSPWIIGDRNSMASTLIGDISQALLTLQSNDNKLSKEEIEELSKKIRSYGVKAGKGIHSLLKMASLAGIPYAGVIGGIVEAGVNELENIEGKTLAEQKQDIITQLEKIDHRFIIVMDDLDRLEPEEIAEIMRLVRAVGDFPNIIYLLCYDRKVLSQGIQKAIKVESGKSYLQKIIQVAFSVPRPEEFDLRRWLFSELSKFYTTITRTELKEDCAKRLSEVCDVEGARLKTPREVVKIINSIRLFFPPIATKVDYADLCWLQIIRILNEKFYQWVEDYLVVYSAVEEGARLSDIEKKNFSKKLMQFISDKDSFSFQSLWWISSFIPGIKIMEKDISKSLFTECRNLAELEAEKRLGSPQHYRMFFSFSQPSGAVADERIQEIIIAADKKQALSLFLDLLSQKRPQGGTMYEVMIDRISRKHNLSVSKLKYILLAIGDSLDEAQKLEKDITVLGQRMLGRRASQILASALKKMNEKERSAFLIKLFKESKSIGWLLSEIIGDQIFAHGIAGHRPEPEENRMLSSTELETCIEILLDRLKGKDRSRIAKVPNILSFLYRWKQTGQNQDLNEWIKEQSKTDRKFLDLMGMLRGWSTVNDQLLRPLHKRDISAFTDYNSAIHRLEKISKRNANKDNREKAKKFLASVKIANEHFGED